MRPVGWNDPAQPAASGRVEIPGESPGSAREAIMRRARARLDAGAPLLDPTAGEALLRWNLACGAGAEARRRWEEILRGRGLAVVTGQQPSLLGGPLYSLYKLITAAALARWIESATDIPTLAVFWVVGDDSDFGEVSAAWIPWADGRVQKLRDAAAPPSGTMIGLLPASRQSELAARESELFLSHPRGRDILDLVAETAARGRNWSEMQAALFFRILPPVPFLVVDGAEPALLRSSRDWLRRAATQWPLETWLREGAEEARAAGHEPALDPELGRRALFRIEGDRRETPEGELDGNALVAPNVVLRPLLQDAWLPNVATVGGPAELRYRAQLGPLYRQGGVPEPVRLPRLAATLVPELPPSILSDGGEREAYLLGARDPDAFLASLLERFRPEQLLGRTAEVRDRLRRDLAGLDGPLRELDPSLTQLAESVAGKADFQLRRIEEGIEAKARHRLAQREPLLGHWKELVRPRDEAQERSLSLLTPFLSQEDAAAVFLRAAEEHVSRMVEGGSAAEAVFVLERAPAEKNSSRDTA